MVSSQWCQLELVKLNLTTVILSNDSTSLTWEERPMPIPHNGKFPRRGFIEQAVPMYSQLGAPA